MTTELLLVRTWKSGMKTFLKAAQSWTKKDNDTMFYKGTKGNYRLILEYYLYVNMLGFVVKKHTQGQDGGLKNETVTLPLLTILGTKAF